MLQVTGFRYVLLIMFKSAIDFGMYTGSNDFSRSGSRTHVN